MMNTVVLITGATGFVGKHLVRHLLNTGYLVKAVGRQPSLGFVHPNLSYHSVENIAKFSEWNTLLKDVSVVVHLAARVHHQKDKGMQSLAEYQEVNVKGTQYLAKASVNAGVKRFIYVSTIKVLGERTIDMPLRAEDRPSPKDAYSLSKLQAEQILQEECRRSGLEWVIIRPPLVYGPRVKGNFRRVLNLSQYCVPLPFSALRNKRSLVSIYNLCSFIECCLTHPHAHREVFLVSDNEDVSTPELIKTLRHIKGKRGKLFPLPTPFLKLAGAMVGKRKEVDRVVDSLQVNIEKTARLLGWKPPHTVRDSLTALVEEENKKE